MPAAGGSSLCHHALDFWKWMEALIYASFRSYKIPGAPFCCAVLLYVCDMFSIIHPSSVKDVICNNYTIFDSQ